MATLPTSSKRVPKWGGKARWLPALLLAVAAPAGAYALLGTSSEPDSIPLAVEVAEAASLVASPEAVGPGGTTKVSAPDPSAPSVRLEGQVRPKPLPRARPVRTEAAAIALLRRSRGWTAFLSAWLSFPTAVGPVQRRERVERVLTLADPVVRQNTIFLAAVTLPWDEVRPWLQGLSAGPDADDAEDALCALAFSGEPAALADFRGLARTTSGADVRRLVDHPDELDALAAEGTRAARDALRAWRSIEVLDRTPYFRLVRFHATRVWWDEGADEVLAWRPNPQPPAVQEALLEAWLARYPGHPGSDNMAVRLGHLRAAAGDAVGSARWFARALTLPDQYEAQRAAGPLVALCETVLPLDVLLSMAGSAGSAARTLFLYAYLRRLAAGTGFEAACRALETLADREPDLLLSVAWRNRWSAPVTPGLESGLEPLAPGDPLRRSERAAVAWPPVLAWPDGREVEIGAWDRSWEATARLEPYSDTCVLERDRLVRQVRAWDTLAELERRTARARGTARADLLYKQAAVLYHDRDALFPVYGHHTLRFRGMFEYSPLDTEGRASEERRRRLEAYGEETFAWERARALFERLEREHGSYPAMDRVIFSAGMCWKRLVDYRPRGAWNSYDDEPAIPAVRACVACFERVAREFPKSPLADDAARAAAWWRKNRSEAFPPEGRLKRFRAPWQGQGSETGMPSARAPAARRAS